MSADIVMDKSRLAAFVDGELSPEEAAEVVLHLADHPQDQAYVDDLMVANEALAQAFADPLSEPVPQAIEEAIMGPRETAEIIPFRRRPSIWVGTALAASVALAMIAGPAIFAPGETSALAVGSVAEGSGLAQALNTLPSGTPEALDENREMMILATLPIDGGFCREVEIIDRADARIDLGVACRADAVWTVEVTLSEPLEAAGTEDGFVTASGAEMQGLMPFLDRLGVGAALDPEAEAQAIERGWTP